MIILELMDPVWAWVPGMYYTLRSSWLLSFLGERCLGRGLGKKSSLMCRSVWGWVAATLGVSGEYGQGMRYTMGVCLSSGVRIWVGGAAGQVLWSRGLGLKAGPAPLHGVRSSEDGDDPFVSLCLSQPLLFLLYVLLRQFNEDIV